MRNLFATLMTLLMLSTTVFAADNPMCVIMKFTNDTRYQKVDAADLLSDLVMEKLLASGKINIVGIKPINKDIEMLLYKDNVQDILNAESSIKAGDFNLLFEGEIFDSKHAQSISMAEVGQIINPKITSAIGKANNAEYLIQGTIITMGKGYKDARQRNRFGGSSTGVKSVAIGVVADLRIIKASNGEVIWRTTGTGTKTNKLIQWDIFKLGSAKLNSEMYNTIMERCADALVKNLLKDLNAGKLFVK